MHPFKYPTHWPSGQFPGNSGPYGDQVLTSHLPFLPFSAASRYLVIPWRPSRPSVPAARVANHTWSVPPPVRWALRIKPRCARYSKVKTGEEKGQGATPANALKQGRMWFINQKTLFFYVHLPFLLPKMLFDFSLRVQTLHQTPAEPTKNPQPPRSVFPLTDFYLSCPRSWLFLLSYIRVCKTYCFVQKVCRFAFSFVLCIKDCISHVLHVF